MPEADIREVHSLSELRAVEAQELSDTGGTWRLELNKTTHPKRRPGFARNFYYYRNSAGAYHPRRKSIKVDVPLTVAEEAV